MIRLTTEERAALVPLAAPGCIEIPKEFQRPEGERRAFGRSPGAATHEPARDAEPTDRARR